MFAHLINWLARVRYALGHHIYWTPFDDGHALPGFINEPCVPCAPGESDVERRACEEKLHVIRDGHPSSSAFDPERHLHVVDRGGMPADDD